ncbi:MAG: hypothetical protein ACFE9R_06725, partial [Candidatus Hermodarchaeota archaeon]
MKLSQFARDYLTLGLRINKHIPGYVEHYYGPIDVKQRIDDETIRSPKKLLDDCRILIDLLVKQGFEKKRMNFLSKNLLAIETTLLILNGEYFSYLDKVQKLFDFKPIFYEDDYFYSLSLKAEKIYKGKVPLNKRIEKYSNRRAIPIELLKNYFTNAIEITRKRTNELFPRLLPDNERIFVNEVRDQSWVLYNWYQGNFISRLDINISELFYWTYLLDYACHEAYPGHHTESSVKDNLLFRKKGYFETTILLIYTPEMVIHEGIGRKASSVLFEPFELAQISKNEFCIKKKLEDPIEEIIKQDEIRKGFMRLQQNLAYHKYVDHWSDIELIRFMKKLKIISKEKIE